VYKQANNLHCAWKRIIKLNNINQDANTDMTEQGLCSVLESNLQNKNFRGFLKQAFFPAELERQLKRC
jgi:hypothetical protein